MNRLLERRPGDSPTAWLVIVGDEVLAHEVSDRNTPLLLARLATWGVRVHGVGIIPDDAERIREEVSRGLAMADHVLVTGGIGPTHDDLTRQAIGAALGRPLALHPEAEERLRKLAGGHGLCEDDLAMALLPEGSQILGVPDGSPFGFAIDRVSVFPGVPRLLERILEANRGRFSGIPWTRRELHTRLSEGRISQPLRILAASLPEVRFGSYPDLAPQGWTLRLVVRGPAAEVVEEAFGALRALVVEQESLLPEG
jgi:molybdenum cofactor synthesis domain-containing protein